MVAVGCLAERYGKELAESLPEADAVLGFDDYPDIAARLRSILAGERPPRRTPRRTAACCCRSRPVERGASVARRQRARAGAGPRAVRRRLDGGPMAPLKLATGCDRRCSFCAIPSLPRLVRLPPARRRARRGALAGGQGVRELFLVSENSTSYGKDLGDLRLLETLLPELAAVDGIERVRVSYLQPAETRPGLVEAIATTPGVAPYFDLSFQHASAAVLRRMRRFGDAERFLGLLDRVRALAPEAGVRSNVIVGFPGETEDDLETLCDFLVAARLDVVGVFGYSDEDGTEAATFDGKLDEDEVRARARPRHRAGRGAHRAARRGADRRDASRCWSSRCERRRRRGPRRAPGPEVDGTTYRRGLPTRRRSATSCRRGWSAPTGVDLVAEPTEDDRR